MSLTRSRYTIEIMSLESRKRGLIDYIWGLTSVAELRPQSRPGALSVTPHGVFHNLETPQEAKCRYHLTTASVRELGPRSKQEGSLALGSGVHFIERISRGNYARKCVVAVNQARWLYGRVKREDQGTKAFLYTPFFVANIAVL